MTCIYTLSELTYIHQRKTKKLLEVLKNMKTQNFGIEIELTGITRKDAAAVIASYFNTMSVYVGGSYQTYEAFDNKGRRWKCMYDSSIKAQKKSSNRRTTAGTDYKCEVVSPILSYDDINDLQEIACSNCHRRFILLY